MKKIRKIVCQEKMPGDWRSFTIATDEYGTDWEIRGYGKTREEAEQQGINRFNEETKDWDIYGYRI